jgi:hypothetical protein
MNEPMLNPYPPDAQSELAREQHRVVAGSAHCCPLSASASRSLALESGLLKMSMLFGYPLLSL